MKLPIVRLSPWRRSLRAKIIVPYLILTLVVAIASAYVITRVFAISSTRAYENRLFETTGAATDAIVRHERQQLASWRQYAFTTGIADAISNNDKAALQTLIEPMYVNGNLGQVAIVNPAGESLLLIDGSEMPTIPDNYLDWELVTTSLSDVTIRTVGLQTVGDEVYLYTAGAIQSSESGDPAGVLLVGTALDDLAATIETEIVAGVSFYSLSGQPLATTIGDYWTVLLDSQFARRVIQQQGSQQFTRDLNSDDNLYTQLLTPFELNNGQDVGLLGISLVQGDLKTPLDSTRAAIIILFTIMTAATLFLGYMLANSISAPVIQIADAATQVAQGNLDTRVDIKSEDELAELGDRFNEMVSQLGQRHYIEELLGRYVGKNIARELLGGHIDLGGQRVWATVLFSDIRDFTTFTESKDLASLMDELNEYYQLMQEVINEYGGVINKFGGDSILALFGAPTPLENHAESGIKAAVAMMQRLDSLNTKRAARSLPPFNIGIGICTGEMVAGNLGSTERREFTVLGDTVNTASRLSDLNKETPFHSIFVSETVIRETRDYNGWQADDLGPVFVKGKLEPVKVFALMPTSLSKPSGLPVAAD